ncbi:RDD family protein [Paenibacillus aurantius]|uniref:RDD family protein n=1 Tax=Paenibacillus aurantius TaxID=2918900 RepID=A0AA96RDY9_9BACL|nr:RDD family protein [Paenibacillus aurantius]WNQ10302.1 RDD family protein [Paenibacillus aurantius]
MYDSLQKEQTILTPEQVRVHYQTAGVGSRAMAQVVDAGLLLAANLIIVAALGGLGWRSGFGSTADYALAIAILLVAVLNAGYFIVMEYYMGGQTVGKRIMGLRVLQEDGRSAGLLPILIRNLFRPLDFLPFGYFLGAAVMLFSSGDKRLGDMVAGTMVVAEQQKERLRNRKRTDSVLQQWESRIPHVVLYDSDRQAFTREDWVLLSAWIDSLSSGMSPLRLSELARPVARYLAEKLQHHERLLQDPSAYLVAVYLQLREDWEL